MLMRHPQWRLPHLSTGQVVRVRRDSGDEFTENNPKGEDIGLEVGDGPCQGGGAGSYLALVVDSEG